MAEDSQFEKRIRDDAETFLSRIVEVERVVEALTPASTLDESTALAVLERLDDLDCLKFAAWCVSEGPEELSRFLGKLNVQPNGIERIAAFAKKYSIYDLFLTRLNRTNQGYENELTRLSSRPSIQTFSNNLMVILRLYNHDRLVITSSQDFDGLIELINMLLEVAIDTAESVNGSTPELLRSALDLADISEIMKRAQALNQLAERVKAKAEQSD
jgi:hypothetical protein